MNTIDLIICIVLAFGAFQGWRRGCIAQVVSLAGLVIAVWLGAQFGTQAGRLCGIDEQFAAPAGFLLVLLAALCAAAIAGRIIRKVFLFAGFGVPDILLGIALGLVKYLLLLSLVLAAFDRMNADYEFVGPGPLSQSKYYRPIAGIAERIFPFVEQLRDETLDRFHRPAAPAAEPAPEQTR